MYNDYQVEDMSGIQGKMQFLFWLFFFAKDIKYELKPWMFINQVNHLEILILYLGMLISYIRKKSL